MPDFVCKVGTRPPSLPFGSLLSLRAKGMSCNLTCIWTEQMLERQERLIFKPNAKRGYLK
jgi:hypothetical protein